MTTETTKTRKAELVAMLGRINEELVNMPATKLGTRWHEDRCAEVRALAVRIEMLSQ